MESLYAPDGGKWGEIMDNIEGHWLGGGEEEREEMRRKVGVKRRRG